MRANRVSACVFAMLVGCTGAGDVEYAGEVRVTSPELIEISPGVEVLADADEPLFYSDGYYWLYRAGSWLRSDSYRGGFARIELAYVPERVRGIEHPQYFVQYRRYGGRQQHARGDQVSTRSQRPYTQPAPVSPYPPPGAGVPSTPPPDTWQPGQPHRPGPQPGGINPAGPQPTPPVTSPNDTHGTPMPPGPGGSITDDHNQAPERALPPGHDRIPPGQGRTPPGQQARPIAPQGPQGPQSGRGAVVPPGQDRVTPEDKDDRPQPGQRSSPGAPPRPEERSAQMRPDDRGPLEPGDQGHRARPEDRSAPGQQPHGTQPSPDLDNAMPDDQGRENAGRGNTEGNRVDQRAQDRIDQGTPPSAGPRTPPPPDKPTNKGKKNGK